MGSDRGQEPRFHRRNPADLRLLRLAPHFVRTSPFGRIEGAEEFLRIVEPMSRKSPRDRAAWRARACDGLRLLSRISWEGALAPRLLSSRLSNQRSDVRGDVLHL